MQADEYETLNLTIRLDKNQPDESVTQTIVMVGGTIPFLSVCIVYSV